MTRVSQRWGATREGDHWRVSVWAPTRDEIGLRLDGRDMPLEKTPEGWHTAEVMGREGEEYMLLVDGNARPDPASRQQTGDVHSASLFADPVALPHVEWHGRPWEEAVILEIHVGTFTAEGSLAAAAERLEGIAALGFTAVELMPLAQFAGNRGWGYDGVLPNAIHPAYGTPEDMITFVNAAHEAGLMVLVDVVYNHFGPEGAYISEICPAFFDAERQTPWGAAIDFNRPEVRGFFIQNAEMWVAGYGVDGLRLDAVHQIQEAKETAFLTELARHLEGLNLGRRVHLVTEDERNLTYYTGDSVLRAQWNDDYHHAVHCLLTGESHSYYAPFAVHPFDDLVTALRDGQVDQGQVRPVSGERRGEPSGDVPPEQFINSNQTHDQIGNRARGDRLISLVGSGDMRVMHAMLLLAPYVPMLFQGEEVGARAPFQFFTDFHGDLAEAVRKGRRSEFPEFGEGEVPDPNDPATFERSKPYAEPPEDAEDWQALTRECLSLRAAHVVPLLKSGYRHASAEREGNAGLRARWDFEGGALEVTFAKGGAAPDPRGREIFSIEGPDTALRVGMEEAA